METGLLHLHSILRWIILVLLLISIYTTCTNNTGAKKVWLFTLVASHIMLLIGIYQWFWGRYGFTKVSLPQGESIMQNKFYRFFLVEHPLMMIIAILLITLAYSSTKSAKYKKAFWFYIVALVLILAAIPWPFRAIVGENRGWLPGM